MVIVGGGIVGCSLAYHLTRLGRRDVLVLDQGPLFHNRGSTSHAPGLMFQNNASRAMTRLAMWSVEAYASARPPGDTAFFQVGSLELATTPARLEELRRRLGQAMACGLDGGADRGGRGPAPGAPVRPDGILGALHVPGDCVVRAAPSPGRWPGKRSGPAPAWRRTVPSPESTSPAAGCAPWRLRRAHRDGDARPRGRHLGAAVGGLAGVAVPLTPVQHLFAQTTPLAELAGETAEVRHPILRHQDRDLYFRQHGDGYGFGSYPHEPLLVEPERIPPGRPSGHPAVHARALRRVPGGRAGAAAGAAPGRAGEPFNGLFSFTPDGFPLLGESPDVRGLLGGRGRVDHPRRRRRPGDGRVDGRRQPRHRPARVRPRPLPAPRHDPAYVRARGAQQYARSTTSSTPCSRWSTPADCASALLAPAGGARRGLLRGAGWERPQWFGANEALLRRPAAAGLPARAGWAARHWSPIFGAEHRATRAGVALFDLSSFAKVEVGGPGARAFFSG